MDDNSISAMCAAHGPVASACRFPAGAIFGGWRLTAFIGRGGNGEVYCAEHVSLGTSAAVKVLVRDEPRAKERFAREAKLLFELKSASFPKFLEYGEANGFFYLVMELLEPGDLPTGDRGVARFLRQVCDAVAELHARGIVHRDIKPGNILWRTRTTGGSPVAVPVLSDLGLAKKIETSDIGHPTSSVTLGGVGTPGYSAPEQMERGEATVASDIHALGVLADTCFDGNPPRRWARIIRRSTSSIPAQRYQSAAEFACAIRWRNFGRWFICLSSALTALAAIVWFCCKIATAVAPFPHMTHLEGRTVVVPDPIVLAAGKEYQIVGPGTLDADIFCPTTTVVRLKNCVLLNRTKRLYPENGIRYRLENGVYLNFINVLKKPLELSIREFADISDGAYNHVRFGGPATVPELMDQIYDEYMTSGKKSCPK